MTKPQSRALALASALHQKSGEFGEYLDEVLKLSGEKFRLETEGKAAGYLSIAHHESGLSWLFPVGEHIIIAEIPNLVEACVTHALRASDAHDNVPKGQTQAVKGAVFIYAFFGLPPELNRVMATCVAFKLDDLDRGTALSLIGTKHAKTFDKLFR